MLDKLTENMNFNDANQLWCEYLTKLLDIIDRDPKSWVPVTAERCIFETILTNSGNLNDYTYSDIVELFRFINIKGKLLDKTWK